jgi:NADPH:quinone reductase-like Zn-dependent oxidoreductase
MKAIRVTEYGGPEVLRLQEIETPEPGPGQARVQLAAEGVKLCRYLHAAWLLPAASALYTRVGGLGPGMDRSTRQDFVAETRRLTRDHGTDLIFDGVGKTTFAGDLEAAAVRGTIVVFGAASGPADPVSPNALRSRSLTRSPRAIWATTLAHVRNCCGARRR